MNIAYHLEADSRRLEGFMLLLKALRACWYAFDVRLLRHYHGIERCHLNHKVAEVADVPRKWVSVLERATLRQGLSDLTFLAFANLALSRNSWER